VDKNAAVPIMRNLKKLTAARLQFFTVLLIAMAVQTASALNITAVTSDNGYAAHRVQWKDSAGLPRVAVMVDQNSTNAPYTGYLRQYTYQVNGTNRICTGTENYATRGNLEFSGDGFVQNHTAGGGDFSSGNGPGVPGTTTIALQGTSHAIIQYYMPNYQIDGPYNVINPAPETVPTMVQWFFADGQDHPIFSVMQDATQTAGNLGADSRSPYGDMAYDGFNTTTNIAGANPFNSYVGGASYGDNYKFVTLAATGNSEEVTTNSAWEDSVANTIPYAMQWAQSEGGSAVDAEMGHVATVPGTIYDQGEDCQQLPIFDPRQTNSVPYTNGMLEDEAWAFQILNFQWPDATNHPPITAKRLTWGRNYGSVGGFDGYGSYDDITNYSQHWTDPRGHALTGDRADGMLLAYSVFVVFGTHNGSYTNGAVAQQVGQMEAVTGATFQASVGTVVTSGPAGIGNATNRTIGYSPAGFNPTYAAWEISASAGAVNASLSPNAGQPLDHPLILVDNYTSPFPPTSISVGSGLNNPSSDYFATWDTAHHQLWITVNRVVSDAMNLVITAPSSPPAFISSIPAAGSVNNTITILGGNFTGATAVGFGGANAPNFTINSDTNISVVVPEDAQSGPISVTTGQGTAYSGTDFTVGTNGIEYVLTVNILPADGGGVTGAGTNVIGGTNYLTATPAGGFKFTGWSGGATGSNNPLAVILNGNVNITANFSPLSANDFLILFTNGNGKVTPALNGKLLAANKKYTLTAVAAPGSVFSNWTGSIVSTKNPLTFEGGTNLTLTANFIPNPFLAVKGIYNGLFMSTNGVTLGTAGMIKGLTVGTKGTYSGSLLLDGASHGFSGSFNLAGQTTNNLKFPATPGGQIILTMSLGTSNGAPLITGIVNGIEWMSPLTAYLETNTLPSGQFTLLMPPGATNGLPTNSPGGYSYAAITNHAGTVKITGAMADGTVLSQSTTASQDGRVPVYAKLYGGKGLVLGWINLDLTNFDGTGLTWIHPAERTGLYRGGFTNVVLTNNLRLAAWTTQPSDVSFFNVFSIAPTIYEFGQDILVTNRAGKLFGPGVAGTFNLKTGVFKITVGSGSSKVTGYGASEGIRGGGYYLTKTNAEAVIIVPPA
jgi:hypothetical protein